MARKTSGTWWIIPETGLQMFRATALDDGNWAAADGGTVTRFNPSKARYVTSDMLTTIAATCDLTIHGDVTSKARFLKVSQTHAWKQVLNLKQALAHKSLGRTMPSEKVLMQAFESTPEVEC